MSFMVVGHTKFAPDWCFGLLKQGEQNSAASLTASLRLHKWSAVCNVSQLVSREDGTAVDMYDWTSFFVPRFKKLTGIKKHHHFYMDSARPGEVVVKQRSDSLHKLLKGTLILFTRKGYPSPR